MFRLVAALPLALLVAARAMPAQDQPSDRLATGSPVRITVGKDRVIGRLSYIDGDSLVLRRADGVHRWPRWRVDRIEVGHRRSRIKPTVVGLIAGAATGATVGAAIGGSTGSHDVREVGDESRSALGWAIGASVGGLAGAVLGHNLPPWNWTDVTLARVGLTLRGWTPGVRVAVGF